MAKTSNKCRLWSLSKMGMLKIEIHAWAKTLGVKDNLSTKD
jgi:hypothetical protein